MGKGEMNSLDELAKEPFDIIVPTHNKLNLTVQCLDAIYEHTKLPFHLIIVDDSTDFTPKYVESLDKDNITFIHSDEPFKTGNQFFNVALEKCKHEYVATVMNSVRVESEWEFEAVNLLNQNKNIGTIGLKCLYPDGRIESAGIALMGFDKTFNGTAEIGRNLPGHRLAMIYEVDAVQWALAIHRVAALKGNIDSDTFYGFRGWDDIDNCFAVKSKGWKVFFCGMGCGYHRPRSTRGTSTKEGLVQNRANAEKFYKRWGMFEDYKKHFNLPDDYDGIKDEMPDEMWSTLQDIDAYNQ